MRADVRRKQFYWLGDRRVSATYFLTHGGVAEISQAIDCRDFATFTAMLVAFRITGADWKPVAFAATGRAAALVQKKLDIRAWPFLAIYDIDNWQKTDHACVEEILKSAVGKQLTLTRKLVKKLLVSQNQGMAQPVTAFTDCVTDIIGETPLCRQVHALLGEDFIPDLNEPVLCKQARRVL